VREENGHTPVRIFSMNDHLGITDMINERLRLQRRQQITGPGSPTDRFDSHSIKPRPTALFDDLAGFGIIALGQHTRFTDALRYPALAAVGFDGCPLLLKLRIAVPPRHRRMIA